MKALLVLDMQKGILECKDFSVEKEVITNVLEKFKTENEPTIFLKHRDDNPESTLYYESTGSNLVEEYTDYADYIVEKTTPSAFKDTGVEEILTKHQVNHVVIVGFNTEYCCLFTSIAAFEKGYKVTLIEDATGTANDEEVYEMPGLDIKDFIGSVLNWSNVIEVLYYDEYVEAYTNKRSYAK
ncbi:isochorismatase family cysteine hydrolase [Bacillus mobilis]|uniref:isochorismatase family cysteine hydrolase n=1 Tax=Bacillus mobilis TaxID=2026190 RepID=UPI002E2427BD|nr:cysteine hydrolase [Bacillus mobilis]MED0957595.1 cysteine hydrolase [Bacillus mobilis]